MPTLDTRLDWEAIRAVAAGRVARPTTPAAPTPTLPTLTKATQTPTPVSPAPRPDLMADLPVDPKARLWTLLDRWTSTPDSGLTDEQALAMYRELVRLTDTPEGGLRYRAWRLAHPEIKMGVISR